MALTNDEKAKRMDLQGTMELVQDVARRFKTECVDAIQLTYAELKALRDNGGLNPGQWYRITDYVTTTTQEDTISAKNQFDVIVMADAPNNLAEDGYVAIHDGVTYFKSSHSLQGWRIKYCIDNNSTRFPWSCPDAGAIMSSGKWYNRYSTGDVEGADYPYAWGTSSNKVFTASKTPAVNDTAYAASDGTGNSMTIEDFTVGKGVIYYMKDAFNNELPYDFKNIKFRRMTVGSDVIMSAADIDFWGNAVSCMYNKPQITYGVGKMVLGSSLTGEWVTGDSSHTPVEIDTQAYYLPIMVRNNNRFLYRKVESELYCYTFVHYMSSNRKDNSLTKFVCNNVMLPYYNNNVIALNNNVFYCGGTSAYGVWNNLFDGNCHDNTIHGKIHNNHFGGEFCYNTIADRYSDEIYNNDFCDMGYNLISSVIKDNKIRGYVYYNIINYQFQNNSINGYFASNNVCYWVKYNCFTCSVESCRIDIGITHSFFGGRVYNSFLNANRSSVTGMCLNSSIGGSDNRFHDLISCTITDIQHSDIRNADHFNSTIYLQDIIVEGGVQYVIIDSSQTTSDSQRVQHIKICQGVCGTSESPKTLTVDVVGQDYQIEFKPVNSEIRNV